MKTLFFINSLFIFFSLFAISYTFCQSNELKTLLDSGVVAIQKSDYKGIIYFHEKALPLAEQETVKRDSLVAVVMHRLSSGFYTKGDYKKAKEWIEKAIEIRKKVFGEEHIDYANSVNNLGNIQYVLGEIGQAEESFNIAIKVTKARLGEKHINYAIRLLSLGNVYAYNLINPQKAEKLYLEAKQIIKESLGEKHPYYALIVNNMGGLYYKWGGKDKEVVANFKEALEIRKNTIGEKHPDYLMSLNNLASTCQQLGRFKEADSLYSKGLSLAEGVISQEHQTFISLLNNLAIVYAESGQSQKAEEAFVKAYNIYSQSMDISNFNRTFTLREIAKFYQIQKNWSKAHELLYETISGFLYQVREVFPFLSEQEKLDFNDVYKHYFDNYYAFLGQVIAEKVSESGLIERLTENVLNNSLTSKALLLNESRKMKQKILGSKDNNLIQEYELWRSQKQTLAKYANLGITEKKNKKQVIDSLVESINNIEKKLFLKSKDFTALNSKMSYTWQDIQKVLKPEEVAIEIIRFKKFGLVKTMIDSSDVAFFREKNTYPQYNRYGSTDTIHYAAILISPKAKSKPKVVILENGNDLETTYLQAYQKLMKVTMNPQVFEDTLLYNAFCKPIAEQLGENVKTVYLSPDGVYHQINLNTLQNPLTKQFVVEESYKIQLLTNLKEILESKSKESTAQTALLFGRPQYSMSKEEYQAATAKVRGSEAQTSETQSMTQTVSEIQWRDLPETEIEVSKVSKLLKNRKWKVEVFTGVEALEERIKKAKNPTILHIATHGYFIPTSDKNQINGMLNSGIVLAGVSTEKEANNEDGILTAYETSDLNLDQTDLVVLSACETGLGEVANGEGVYGLQRGFKVAGVKSLIMSLWKVDDKTTQDFMQRFYVEWLVKEKSKREAFIEAQKQIKKEKAYPYYWGAFVMVGE